MNVKKRALTLGVLAIIGYCVAVAQAQPSGGRGGMHGGAGMGKAGFGKGAGNMYGGTANPNGGGQYGVMQQKRLRDGSCAGQSNSGSQQRTSGTQAGNGNGDQLRRMQQRRMRDGSCQGAASGSQRHGNGSGKGNDAARQP